MRLLLVLLLLLPGSASAAAEVRVLLDRLDEPATLLIPGGHRGFLDDRPPFDTRLPLEWPVRAVGDTLLVDGLPLGRTLTLEPHAGTFEWNGQHYRGALRLAASGGTLLVINVLDLEEYLRGVVPSEMQANWPLEALKAQAIAARSYTLTSLQPDSDYDICATVECQVYRGVAVEHERSDRAVLETAGLVLMHDGAFARTYYHSDSGGVVASSAEVWGESLPYLVAVADISQNTPHRRWEARLDPARMRASLRAAGRDVGAVHSLVVLAQSESGRVTRAEVHGSAGRVTLEGAQLTALLREWGLKSTRFTMTGALTARGDGWGHGVGMSQYGARGLALAGYRFDQILGYYYPQTELSRLVGPERTAQR